MTARVIRFTVAIAAAGLVLLSAQLPLWTMKMEAPQYRKGLYLHAYGTEMTGDIHELNILNHYIGMPPIAAPALETSMFPAGIATLAVLCLASPLYRWLRRFAVATAAAVPVAIIADLQWRLYEFGHSLDPKAPIRLKPFTPLVIGETHMGNFESHAMVSWGFGCLLMAAALLLLGARIGGRLERRAAVRPPFTGTAAAALLLLSLLGGTSTSAASDSLQRRVEQSTGGSVVIDGGVHHGPVVIRGPLRVIGVNQPVIDGNGIGSVVRIEGNDVVFSGFVVRNSGREVTEEAAGISVTGNGHRIEGNTIRDVYFGIHIGGGAGAVVSGNDIEPGVSRGARPGHGVSAWNLNDSVISNNRISNARDGIYLSFTQRVRVEGNRITKCRYGLHSMYSQDARFAGNHVSFNLLGAALMMSDRLVLQANRISRHREGPAAYGVLLKDIGDLRAENNEILGNRIGIYAEGVGTQPGREALLNGNTIAANEVGFALQSNAALVVTANRIAENLTDVRPLGRQLSGALRWSRDGRGNSWGQYRGYDRDRDGIGDVPHRVEDAMDALIRRNPLIQTFLYTPAHLAIEAAARMFPLYRQPPVIEDDRPLMTFGPGGSR